MTNITNEINFQTTRSGGKGGQNVNKVESAVIGFFHINNSQLLSDQQKEILLSKLTNRVNADGFLVVKSQVHRGQLSNKEEVITRMNELVANALKKKKMRISTKPSRSSKEKRIESKKRKSEIKSGRRRFHAGDA